MPDSNDSIRAALAGMTAAELRAVQIAADGLPHSTSGLSDLLSHVCDWELARRDGRNLAFPAPHAALPSEEIAVGLATIVALTESFEASPRVREFFEAVGQRIEAPPPAP